MLPIKSGFIYHVSKIHSLLNMVTETIFIFVGINPRKSYLKKKCWWILKLHGQGKCCSSVQLLSLTAGGSLIIWWPEGSTELTLSDGRFKDSQLCAWPKSSRPEKEFSWFNSIFLALVSLCYLQRGLWGGLWTQDLLGSLQFRKHNTKILSIWLRNDPYL